MKTRRPCYNANIDGPCPALSSRKADKLPDVLTKDSDAKAIGKDDDLDDATSLLINVMIYSPPADPLHPYYAQYAQARVNAYLFLRKNCDSGNPLDPLDIASCVEI